MSLREIFGSKESANVRLNLELSPAASTLLDDLAEARGTTKADILRKALALINIAVMAEKEGKHLAVLDRDTNVGNRITGL